MIPFTFNSFNASSSISSNMVFIVVLMNPFPQIEFHTLLQLILEKQR